MNTIQWKMKTYITVDSKSNIIGSINSINKKSDKLCSFLCKSWFKQLIFVWNERQTAWLPSSTMQCAKCKVRSECNEHSWRNGQNTRTKANVASATFVASCPFRPLRQLRWLHYVRCVCCERCFHCVGWKPCLNVAYLGDEAVPTLSQVRGEVWLRAAGSLEHEAGEQGGDLSWLHVDECVVEYELCQQ